METTWCCMRKRLWLTKTLFFLVAVTFGSGGVASASTPDWLRQAAQAPLPSYSEDTDAVVLLDETVTSVSASGEVHTTHRKAYKILRPQGRKFGIVDVYFDSETQLTFLKGWSITSRGEEYEVKEKDAIETGVSSETLYSDDRRKLLLIPASQPGSVVGYEYQQRQRPYVLQDLWYFQSDIPVRHARFTLDLPSNWVYTTYWCHHASMDPQRAGENRWTWEFTDVEPIRSEPQMPVWRSIAGHLGISFGPSVSDKSYSTWDQIGHWYWDLSSTRREITPPIQQTTHQLVAGANSDLDKIRRLAVYVQNEIRM